jgi:hypothetical protein
MEPTNELDSTNKTCRKCKQEQPVAAFSKGKHSKDGLQSKCKKCYKAYYEANKEKITAFDKTWREDNKEKLAAYNKTWREDNKEKCAASGKAWYEANKEKITAYNKTWREDNKEKLAASGKAWREDNKGYLEVRRIERRANRGDIPSLQIYGLPNRESVEQVCAGKLAIFRKFFGKGEYHCDHMRPLAGAKGDKEEMHKRSHFSNLVYIPAKVNLSKNAKPFWEWFATLKDQKLKKCIALQDAYNKDVERAIAC